MQWKNGKTVGPDSLPIDIYKAFKDQLIRPLFEMFEESLEAGISTPITKEGLNYTIAKAR